MRRALAFACCLLLLLSLLSCTSSETSMRDGYYSAESKQFDEYGWKEFVTIYINDQKIVSVEYNAYNRSGFIKSWDMEYMRAMGSVCHTYPHAYTRAYGSSLLRHQTPDAVDCIAGATTSYHTFVMLAQSAIEQAKTGDTQVALVEIPPIPEM